MHRRPEPSPRRRGLPPGAVAVAIAAVVAANVGALGGDGGSMPAPLAASAPPSRPAAPSTIDLGSISAAAETLARGLELTLPEVQALPDNEYEATPEVRHGTLEVPAIGLSTPFFEGVTLTAINRGPSHWPGTAMPGELGNVVIAGHRTTYTRPFYDLDVLQPGDELVFTTAEGRFVYELTRTEVVPFDGVHIVEQRYAYTATLFACHPKGSARYRIVAHFHLVDARPRAAGGAGAAGGAA